MRPGHRFPARVLSTSFVIGVIGVIGATGAIGAIAGCNTGPKDTGARPDAALAHGVGVEVVPGPKR
jgi:hypothetical protein